MTRPIYLFIDGINPEPWTAPDVSIGYGKGRRPYPIVSKGERLRFFQEAVKESIEMAYPHGFTLPEPGTPIRVTFLFWRQLDSYTKESGRTASRNVADATNMQKATEDALQKVLFGNDRDNKSVKSVVMAEGPDVAPRIIAIIEQGPDPMLDGYRAIEAVLANEARPTIPGNVLVLGGDQ